jgi:Fungal trichothecene efflux pump (TRI12)
LAGVLIGKNAAFGTSLCLLYGTALKTIADGCLVLIQPSGIHSKSFGMGIGFLSMFGTGWTSVSLIVCVQLCCADEDIGMATLILGAVRAVGGSVAVTIYSYLVTTVMKADAGPKVGAAVVPLGFPVSGLEPLINALVNENLILARTLPGVTEPILSAAKEALKHTWAKGYHQVYLASALFSAISVLAAFFSEDVSGNMTNHVAVRLTNEKTKKDTEKDGKK